MLEINTIVRVLNKGSDGSGFRKEHVDRIGYVNKIDSEDYTIQVIFIDNNLVERLSVDGCDEYYWGNPHDVIVIGYRYRN